MTRFREGLFNSFCLGGIVLLHGCTILAVGAALERIPEPVVPPAIIGMLISEASPEPTEKPAPLPVAPPEVQKPSPVRRTTVPRKQPVSERTPTTTPESASAPEPAPLPAPEAGGNQDGRSHEAVASAETSGKGSDELIQPRSNASHLNNPAPDYPAISRRIGEQGNVSLSVYILADGRVGDIRLRQSSGYPRLDQAAIEAVRRWRYVPARRGNEPIDYWYGQTIIFSLNS